MRLVKLPRADGTVAYINPHLIRAVIVNDKQTAMIQFDNDHVIMVREQADKVAQEIEAVTASTTAFAATESR
jgi:uncharacterized protein YlzI (FlbEa/FlbD family)